MKKIDLSERFSFEKFLRGCETDGDYGKNHANWDALKLVM